MTTRTQYREYLTQRVQAQAQVKYPDNPRLQLYYMIGFLTAQTADLMYIDNLNSRHVLNHIRDLDLKP